MSLSYLALGAFKIWMLVDAAQRRAEFYWFLIIFMAPFGEFIYFFVVKVHDFGGSRGVEGWVKRNVGFFKRRSLADLRHNLEHNPSAANQLALAQALAESGEHAQAIELYEKVLDRYGDDKPAMHGLATALAAMNEHARAAEVLERLIALDKAWAGYRAWQELATAQWNAGDRELALGTLRALIAKSSRLEHRTLFAQYLVEVGERDEGQRTVEKVLADYRTSPRYVQRAEYRSYRRAKSLISDLAQAAGSTPQTPPSRAP